MLVPIVEIVAWDVLWVVVIFLSVFCAPKLALQFIEYGQSVPLADIKPSEIHTKL